MPTIHTHYKGNLRTSARHLGSGNEIITDAPLDNQGRGEAFSPSDLLSAALGSCMLTIMGIAARTHGFSVEGTEIDITKVMASNPRRVKEVFLVFKMPPVNYSEREKSIIRTAALTCPVALSLHPDIRQEVDFKWH